MPANLLQTKLYAPHHRPFLVVRPHLVERLDRGLQQGSKLTLISAPAGFGKTTLAGAWIAAGERPTAWLSLDEADGDLARFLIYLVAAVQTVAPEVGERALTLLQSPQLPPTPSILTTLLNEIAARPQAFSLVLDDYHLVEARPVDEALAFLLEHLPPQMHLVITTREDPNLPLARLRARRQLTELRARDLRFTVAETTLFLQDAMGLDLSQENIAALEARTEGWIAGLQLAALALQGQAQTPDQDATGFVDAFRGSHRFVLDYLVEEVLQQQPAPVQSFLLQTSILDRLCGPLCDAVCVGTESDAEGSTPAGAQATLEALERANLFLVPLDGERRWYRYHHLFRDLLRQRLEQSAPEQIEPLHARASAWYESQGLETAAFQHAAKAGDTDRAARLVAGGGMPLHFRGVLGPVLDWLESVPEAALDARPALWVTYASALMMTGRPPHDVEAILNAAEAALEQTPAAQTDDLLGQIAAIRAMLAIPQNKVDTIRTEAQRALALLDLHNLPVRTTTTWALGYAYQIQGERAAAVRAYQEAIAASRDSGNIMATLAATTCLGQVQETENQLQQAAASYQQILDITGRPPWPTACEAYAGLARIHYQWNKLDEARQFAQESLRLAQDLANVDTPAACGLLLARLKLAQSDLDGAAAHLSETEQFVQRHNFNHWLPEVAAVQVRLHLQRGELQAALRLAQAHDLPLGKARVYLAQGEPARALAGLQPLYEEAQARGWQDKELAALVLQALAHEAQGTQQEARQRLQAALALAAPGGFIRLFVDEGPAMAALLRKAVKQGLAASSVPTILAAFPTEEGEAAVAQPLPDPLTERELDVLRLLAGALSGPEIARELTVSLNTMRTHTKNIYSKLGVNSRRAAVRRAQALDLL